MKEKREVGSVHASVSNELLDASYSLTLTERRVVVLALARMNSKDDLDSRDWFRLKISEYASLFNLTSNRAREILKEEHKRLYDRTITVKDKKVTMNFRWIEAIKYDEEEDAISLRWTNTILPYISELRSNFTRLHMEDIAKIDGSYASRLFDLLYQERYKGKIGKKHIDIVDLVTMWRIPPSLQVIDTIKRVVLIPAIKELAKKELIQVEMLNGRKEGRKILGLTFSYTFLK